MYFLRWSSCPHAYRINARGVARVWKREYLSVAAVGWVAPDLFVTAASWPLILRMSPRGSNPRSRAVPPIGAGHETVSGLVTLQGAAE